MFTKTQPRAKNTKQTNIIAVSYSPGHRRDTVWSGRDAWYGTGWAYRRRRICPRRWSRWRCLFGGSMKRKQKQTTKYDVSISFKNVTKIYRQFLIHFPLNNRTFQQTILGSVFEDYSVTTMLFFSVGEGGRLPYYSRTCIKRSPSGDGEVTA